MPKRGVPISTPTHLGSVPKRNRPSARTERGLSLGTPSDDVEITEIFACPFFRRDPVQHIDCLGRKLKRISDVKQHINRRHLNDIVQCPNCNLTFGSSIDLDEHINLSCCSSATPYTIQQSIPEQLRARAPPGTPIEDVYSALCGILFGKQETPVQPYLGPILLESTALLWSFWQSEKASLIQTVVNQSASSTAGDMSAVVLTIVDQLRMSFEQHVKALPVGGLPSTPASATLSNIQEEILQADSLPMQLFGSFQTSDVSFGAQLPTSEGSHNSISVLAFEGAAMSMSDGTGNFSNTIGSNNDAHDLSFLRQDEHHSSAEVLFGTEASLSTNLDIGFIFM
ncbi:unnamed protein product [Clonostachys byssicola]|uniref:C2H2-type domain-containing protein n=1 Tax=Clonostachys byssicola TaxID=160290 RepID=A0A9N9Y3D0_9HYPO|nr:unnamed protein product [Clonostachys byssicola]